MKSNFFVASLLLALSACATIPPRNPDNICQIFREKEAWYHATLSAARRWGTPIAIQLSIINQESSFVADATPPRPYILGLIPWFRASSAYGYPQAKDETWSEYQQKTGNWLADREDFADSCDFVAWYCAISRQKLGIAASDAHKLYLAYHEGHGGFKRESYAPKQWLLNTAQKVDQRAWRYDKQLATCRQEFENQN